MKKLLFLIIVSLMFTGVAFAGDNDWIALGPDEASWSGPTNWVEGWVPLSTEKISWSNDGTAKCIVDINNAVTGQFVLGDNGPQDFLHQVTIRNGSFLNTCVNGNSWTASGYNRSSSLTVQYRGRLETGNRMGVGLVDGPVAGVPIDSYLNVDGGTVRINGALQVSSIDHNGHINVNAGTLEANGLEIRGTPDYDYAFIDIGLGTFIFGGDDVVISSGPTVREPLATFLDNGNITAFASLAAFGLQVDPNVIYDPVTDTTTITAEYDPLDRSPEYGITLMDGAVTLSWLNLPNGGNTVYIDLYYGTDISYDPNTGLYADFNQVLFDSPDALGYATSSASADYYWRVDTHFNNPISDPNVVEGYIMAFTATNDRPPKVFAEEDMLTWIGYPTQLGPPVQNAYYTDDGASPITLIRWSSGGDPNTWFNDGLRGADVEGDEAPTVTCDAVKDVILTFTVKDTLNEPVSDSMWIYVYEDACDAARNGDGRASDYQMDIYPEERDCFIGFNDLLVLISEWLTDYALTEEYVIVPE